MLYEVITMADCADPDGNGAKNDACMWWECVSGTCVGTDIVFGAPEKLPTLVPSYNFV